MSHGARGLLQHRLSGHSVTIAPCITRARASRVAQEPAMLAGYAGYADCRGQRLHGSGYYPPAMTPVMTPSPMPGHRTPVLHSGTPCGTPVHAVHSARLMASPVRRMSAPVLPQMTLAAPPVAMGGSMLAQPGLAGSLMAAPGAPAPGPFGPGESVPGPHIPVYAPTQVAQPVEVDVDYGDDALQEHFQLGEAWLIFG